MDGLANLEDVVRVGGVCDENLVGLWHKGAPKDSCNHEDHRDVKHHDACTIVSEDVRQRLRSEYEKAEPLTEEQIVLHSLDIALLAGNISVFGRQFPVCVGVGEHVRRRKV